MAVPEIDIRRIIANRREEHGKEGLGVRRQAEEKARAFLDTYAGRMTAEQARELAATLNSDFHHGRNYQTRFVPGLHGAILDLLLSNMEAVNEYTHRLWRGSEEEALQALHEIVTDKSRLPGAGRSYPSVLLYLRDTARLAIWMGATEKGLKAASHYGGSTQSGGKSAYLQFCEAAEAFRREYELEPEMLDGVLADIMRAQRQGAEAAEKVALPRDAFSFLAELRDSNTRAWFDQNRGRYQESLDKPLRRILEQVASRRIRDLDAALDTEVKRGHVMAALRKRFHRGEGEYHDYYWGAFSRSRKQEDVQLYVNVHWDRLEFGLSLASATPNRRDTLQANLERSADELWASLEPHVSSLRFLRAEDQGKGEQMVVDSPGDFLLWAKSPNPQVVRELAPDDPLTTSPELVDEIIRMFELLHPIAKLAWGELIDIEHTDEVEEAAETDEPYPLERLAADTYLPIEDLQEWADLLRGSKRQALFYGPPGTGKTFVAERLARHLAYPGGEVKTVQFHPSFSYEDFIEGLRPRRTDEGSITYEISPGVFYEFCEDARGRDALSVLVIDEINRAELGSVLGELMLLLEYRGKQTTLPYSKRKFSVPRNIVVIGTLNTADRSLALVDFALRRRFHAIEMLPSRRVLEESLRVRGEADTLPLDFFDLIQERLNSRDFAPGHSYWMADDLTPIGLNKVWRYEIRPYLAEYWFEHRTRLEELDREVAELLAAGI